jgi:NADH pyrophosphatase NudC (nudix superfamily)
MIGCVAKAKSDDLHVDQSEMEEVRWVSRDVVAQALSRSSGSDNPLLGERTQTHTHTPHTYRYTHSDYSLLVTVITSNCQP